MSLKILHIIDNLGLWWAQTVVKWIFEIQVSNNDIYLYTIRKTEIQTSINHKNIILDNSKNKYNFPILKLRDFIKKNDIQILHCHLAKSQIIWALLKKIYFPKIKLVFHEHWEIFENWKIYPFLMNLFKNIVDIYIAVSKATKKIILEKTNYNPEKIKILYNFVDLDKFKKIWDINIKKERKKYNLNNDDIVIWFASRLNKSKWYIDFLESANKLIKKWYDYKFLIAWDWWDKDKIIEYIRKNNLSKNIKLIWYVKDMTAFYNTINCFVFPSHRESLWITWIEANACACPVVASNIDWLNEIMIDNKNAILFEKQNTKELAESIEKIIGNLEIKNSLIKNWLTEVKKYSLKKYIINLNKIYE